ncbi:hypothetical protein BDZ91DRAFT_649933 [Kalaharituber pfeilii]|nr:hypothetical protein BDZ91DRAFT_649933 [Kalaharituber pfeilii]
MGFSDYFALDNHVVQTHIRPQIGFACQWEACGEAEKDLSHLLDHVKASHTSNTNQGNGHVCLWQGCNATFTNSEDLSHHLTNVHLQSPIGGLLCQWEACGIQADGPDGLTTHLHRDHFLSSISEASGSTTTSSASYCTPPLDQTLVCQWAEVEGGPICGKQFATADALQVHAKDDHIAILKKKTGYFCRWAGCTRREKEFSQKGKVERHMQTHTGFKSCRCPHCDKEFSAPQALQQHIRTHTGEKPYKCDICGKEFAQGSAMTMHKRVHTGERPLKCDYPGCNKRFSESSNLSKHRKTHNPVGQHRCGFPGCERSFHRLGMISSIHARMQRSTRC